MHVPHTVLRGNKNTIQSFFSSLLFSFSLFQPYTFAHIRGLRFGTCSIARECSLAMLRLCSADGVLPLLSLALFCRFFFLPFYYFVFSCSGWVSVCVRRPMCVRVCVSECVPIWIFGSIVPYLFHFGRGTLYKCSRFCLLTIIQGLFANQSTYTHNFILRNIFVSRRSVQLRCIVDTQKAKKKNRIFFIHFWFVKIKFVYRIDFSSQIHRVNKHFEKREVSISEKEKTSNSKNGRIKKWNQKLQQLPTEEAAGVIYQSDCSGGDCNRCSRARARTRRTSEFVRAQSDQRRVDVRGQNSCDTIERNHSESPGTLSRLQQQQWRRLRCSHQTGIIVQSVAGLCGQHNKHIELFATDVGGKKCELIAGAPRRLLAIVFTRSIDVAATCVCTN